VSANGLLPFYPTSSSRESKNVRYGDICVAKIGTGYGSGKPLLTSTMDGEGGFEQSLYPNDPPMVKAAIASKYNVVCVACTEYNPETDAQDQGFVGAVGGLHTVPKYRKTDVFEPGTIVRAELLDPDASFGAENKYSPGGRALSSYPWIAVPEDYVTPGDLIMTHMSAILEDNDKWKMAMGSSNGTTDKWLCTAKTMGDSALMSGILTMYVLAKMGYISLRGLATQDPYSDNPGEMTRPINTDGALNTPNWCIRMAEILGIQTPSVNSIPTTQEQMYANSLRRRLLSTIFYNGKQRPFEFGQRERNVGNTTQTRDPKNGNVETSTPAGQFLNNQINHSRRATGGILQALDEHVSKRIGFVVSGPARKTRVDIVLGKTLF